MLVSVSIIVSVSNSVSECERIRQCERMCVSVYLRVRQCECDLVLVSVRMRVCFVCTSVLRKDEMERERKGREGKGKEDIFHPAHIVTGHMYIIMYILSCDITSHYTLSSHVVLYHL